MSLVERSRSAEHQGREAAWHGFTLARTSLEEAQSRIRHKMRIHPRTTKLRMPVVMSLEGQKDSATPPRAIVTLKGEDLPPEEPETPEEEVA
jgi:hypothetical protein